MRKHFPGYYQPTEAEARDMWRDAIFAFDANVLLDVFRLRAQTRDRLLEILEGYGDRLWLPHQAAAEFHPAGLTGPVDELRERLKAALQEMEASHQAQVRDRRGTARTAHRLVGRN